MDFSINNSGDLASVIGLFLSVVGLGWAIIKARVARSAAEAAEREAEQARIEGVQTIDHHLLTNLQTAERLPSPTSGIGNCDAY